MSLNGDFQLHRFDFDSSLYQNFQNFHYAKELWPLVYILSDGTIKEAYVGETTDAYARMANHLRSNDKNKLTEVHLITSERFNKSATLDIESNLIKYISGDGKYRLMNGNIGLANHTYYQKKEVYWELFKSIWNKLRATGISEHSIEYIDNSDLYKYSPYKTLSKDQRNGLLLILESLLDDQSKSLIVEGGAGTGKSILAVFLFKLLNTSAEEFNFKEFGDEELEFVSLIKKLKQKYPNPKMALVIPMSSFRNTIKKVFKNIKGLAANMVIGPAEVTRENFDIIVVDESHRLRRRVNLGSYFRSFDDACKRLDLDKSCSSELNWVLKQSRKTILFYDENQSIKPSDVRKEEFDRLKSSPKTRLEYLRSQFRVRGGNDYVAYIGKLLNCQLPVPKSKFNLKDYEFVLFDSIEDMVKMIKLRDQEVGLSRMIAGYSWKWISKNDQNKFDITIDGMEFKWNTVSNDWINEENSVEEIGCIHTTQGYDLNYSGVIFGNEIGYDDVSDEVVIRKEHYFDSNGKASIEDPLELKEFILNIYKTVMLRGIRGTYVYVCDEKLRNYFARYIPIYINAEEIKAKSEDEIEFLHKVDVVPFQNSIPFYNLSAAAGDFSDTQNVNVEDTEWLPIPPGFKSGADLFACRVVGESMNKVIPNGAICMFRRDSGGSRNGKIVLVQLADRQDPDFESGYTVKEYHSKKLVEDEYWQHESITLKPLSNDSSYKSINLFYDEVTSLKVLGIFECVIG